MFLDLKVASINYQSKIMTGKTKFNFDFLSFARIALSVSLATIIYSLVVWFQTGDAKYGVDYKGGHEILIAVENATTEQVRQALNTTAELQSAVVQKFESDSNEFSIRLAGDFVHTTELNEEISSALNAAGLRFEIKATEFIGPTVEFLLFFLLVQ